MDLVHTCFAFTIIFDIAQAKTNKTFFSSFSYDIISELNVAIFSPSKIPQEAVTLHLITADVLLSRLYSNCANQLG
jgi:hypothetical protein